MLLFLWGFTPDRALTVAPGFEGFRTGFPLNAWSSGFFVYRASAASRSWFCRVSFNSYSFALPLALYGFTINLNFVKLCSYMPAELLFLSPTIFGDFRTYHFSPTCTLKSDFAALVRFCEIF